MIYMEQNLKEQMHMYNLVLSSLISNLKYQKLFQD